VRLKPDLEAQGPDYMCNKVRARCGVSAHPHGCRRVVRPVAGGSAGGISAALGPGEQPPHRTDGELIGRALGQELDPTQAPLNAETCL